MRGPEVDPITGAAASSQSIPDVAAPTFLNPYDYADANPLTKTDPDGRSPSRWQGVINFGAGVADAVTFGGSTIVLKATGAKIDTNSTAFNVGTYGTQIVMAVASDGASIEGRVAAREAEQLALRAAERRAAMKSVREAGKEGERLAGIVKNTKRIPSATKSRNFRVPDELNETTIGEVKNVAKQDWTKQLQDDAAYAKEHKLTFNLYVKKTTEPTPALLKAEKEGLVHIIKKLPG